MDSHCKYISYESTGYFSKMMLDYVAEDEKLKSFYQNPVSVEGIKAAIEFRKTFQSPRNLLVQELRNQYKNIPLTAKQEQNLQLLLQPNTFTTCTAHQPNIFTGPLYFIYKILHAIRLADVLHQQIPENNFVPVYYMGSEDADLDELGHIYINGQKLEWATTQTGAVGRMKVDKDLIAIIEKIAGQAGVFEHGNEWLSLLKSAYKEGTSIQQATLHLVNELFNNFGLLILIPDNIELKKAFTPVIKKELTEQFSREVVAKTNEKLGEHYKVQASGRDINLFYLTETKRERIEKEDGKFKVESLGLFWSEEEMLSETDEHPERFSANVILRGVFQETILPNVAFIGGGGEIAYWLQLKNLFETVNVPYPVLIVRNSFLLTNQKQQKETENLGFDTIDLFKSSEQLINEIVRRETDLQLSLVDEKEQMKALYEHMKDVSEKIDTTLAEHISALSTKALEKVSTLEKKMLRAEKRKFEAQQRQINKLREQLFPADGLQERVENFSLFYAKYGKELLSKLYDSSLTVEQQFCLLQLS